MTIYLGADHGGWQLKEQLQRILADFSFPVVDIGAKEFRPDDDYPPIAFQVAQAVAKDPHARGILSCRSGGGMAIVANKVPGIRAVAVTDVVSTHQAREHNDANIITLAGDWLSQELLLPIVKTFLQTKFDPTSRHGRRVQQIISLEKKGYL